MKHFSKKHYLGAACGLMIATMVVSINWNPKHDNTNRRIQTSAVTTTKESTLAISNQSKAEAKQSHYIDDLSIQESSQTDSINEFSPVDDRLDDFDANSFFPTPEERSQAAEKHILDILDLDSGRKEMLSSVISEKFELDVALNDAYRKVLLDPEASDLELRSTTDDFNKSSEEARVDYVNNLSGVLTFEELEIYKVDEMANIKAYLLHRIPNAARKLEKRGIGNVDTINRNLETNIDSLINEKFKMGISLGLLKNSDTGTFSENTSEFHMLTLATEVMHEVSQ